MSVPLEQELYCVVRDVVGDADRSLGRWHRVSGYGGHGRVRSLLRAWALREPEARFAVARYVFHSNNNVVEPGSVREERV